MTSIFSKPSLKALPVVYSELAIVTIIWGLVPLIMRWSAQELYAGTFNLLRYGLTIFALALVIVSRRIQLLLPNERAIKLMALGAATMFPFSYYFLRAVKLVDISIAGMIQGTVPVLTVLVVFAIFRRLPNAKALWGIGITYVGLALFLFLSGRESPIYSQSWLGIFYASIAILSFSVYTSLSKKVCNEVNIWQATLYVCIGVFLPCIPIAAWETWSLGQQDINLRGVVGMGYMSLLATTASLTLYTKAANSVGPYQASMVTNLVPIVIVITGVVFLGESLDWAQISAIGVTMAGLYWFIVHDKKNTAISNGSKKVREVEC